VSRPFLTEFRVNGDVRQLKDPYEDASARQLKLLNELGLLEIARRPGASIVMGEAAAVIDRAKSKDEAA
jgi:hypothetical protein